MELEREEKSLNTHNYLTIHCDKSLEEKQGAMTAYYGKDDLVFPGMRGPRPEISK